MAVWPFTIEWRPDLEASCYEGPFGPLLIRRTEENAVAGQRGIAITGPRVDLATFAWNSTPLSAKGGISDLEQLELGLTVTVDGTTVRLRGDLGITRAGRAIRIERPGQDRRYRLRGFWTRSLETDTGQRLARTNLEVWSGTVSDAADIVDVVLIIVLAHADFSSMISLF